jgi:hypothetical protein
MKAESQPKRYTGVDGECSVNKGGLVELVMVVCSICAVTVCLDPKSQPAPTCQLEPNIKQGPEGVPADSSVLHTQFYR